MRDISKKFVGCTPAPTRRSCIPFREGCSTFPARRRRLRITCLALEHTRRARLPACRDRPTCFSCLTFWRTVWAAGPWDDQQVCVWGGEGEGREERERSRRERQSSVTGRLRSVAVSRLVFATTLGSCRMEKNVTYLVTVSISTYAMRLGTQIPTS